MNNNALRKLCQWSLPALFAILILTLVTSLGGCASSGTQMNAGQEVASPGSVNSDSRSSKHIEKDFELIDERAYHHYVNGIIFQQLGDYVNASKSLERARKSWADSYEINYSYAQVLLRLNKPRNSLEVLESISPLNAEIYNLRASCYRLLGNESKAANMYLQLIKIDSTDSRAYSFVAGYYRRVNNLDSTLWAYHQMARLRPDNYRLFNEIGRLLELSGENNEAKDAFLHSIDINSSSTNILAVLGLASLYESEKLLDSAVSSLNIGLQMEPDNPVIHRQLSGLYARMDSIQLALPHALRLTELQPDNVASFRMLGLLFLSADSLDQADSVFTSLVARGDGTVANHYYLGRIAFLKEDYNRAKDEFQIVVQREDTLSSSWIDLAFTYQKLGLIEEEKDSYLTGLNHVKGDADKSRLLFALAVYYERNENFQKSTETFEEVLAITPDNAQALNYLGYLLADRGERLEYAKKLISRAVFLVPSNAAFLDSFGWVQFKLGNFELAIEYLEKAVKLDTDPVILDHLGDAYQAKGIMEEARIWWGKALELQPDNEEIRSKLNQ